MHDMNWKYFLRLAYGEAKLSRDPSTQNGALLIDNNGQIKNKDCNRFPNGVQDTAERWQRPLKYKIIEHAERNVIFNAARSGIVTDGLIMVCPWAACSDCARAIIQSGVAMLVTHKPAHDRSPDFWRQEIEVAFMMLKEARVEVVMYNKPIGGVEGVLYTGVLWNP